MEKFIVREREREREKKKRESESHDLRLYHEESAGLKVFLAHYFSASTSLPPLRAALHDNNPRTLDHPLSGTSAGWKNTTNKRGGGWAAQGRETWTGRGMVAARGG